MCSCAHVLCKYTMEVTGQLPMLFLRNHCSCFWTQGLSVSWNSLVRLRGLVSKFQGSIYLCLTSCAIINSFHCAQLLYLGFGEHTWLLMLDQWVSSQPFKSLHFSVSISFFEKWVIWAKQSKGSMFCLSCNDSGSDTASNQLASAFLPGPPLLLPASSAFIFSFYISCEVLLQEGFENHSTKNSMGSFHLHIVWLK